MLNWWAFKAIHLMRTKICGRTKIKSPSLPLRKDQGRPDTLLAITTKSVCCYVCPGGSREILEPIITRVESSLRCLTLVCYMTPAMVEQEVEGLGYAETAGAGEELRDCCG